MDEAAAGRSALAAARYPWTNFADVLAQRAREQPDRTAFVFLGNQGQESERHSFASLHARAEAVAAEIARRGLAGKNLLLLFPPGLDFVVALFACFRAGAVAVPIPYTAGRRTADRLSAICRDAQPAGVLSVTRHEAAREFLANEPELTADLAWLDVDGIAAADGAAPTIPPPPAASLALLQYTSGSTSAPKGVMLTHGNLLANNAMIAAAFGHDESLRGVGWLPLFHDMGLVGHVLQPVFVGGLSVLMSPLAFLQRPSRWLEAISTWRATTSGGPSHGYALCLRHFRDAPPESLDLSSWKVAYCGSEPVRGDVLEAFAGHFAPRGFRAEALLPCYGLAEATLLVTSRAAASGLSHAPAQPAADGAAPGGFAATSLAVSCGRPWAGGTVAIVDAETKQPLPDGEIGEICVAGPHLARGYWRRPAENRATFGSEDAADAGGLLRTGDLGFLSAGELFVLGRIKDTIIVFGLKHAAEDIERAVSTSDGLFDRLPAAAFAVATADGEGAVIVQEVPGRTVDAERLAAAADAAASAVIAAQSLRLSDVVLVKAGSLPRTTSGKVQRSRARQIHAEGGFARLNPTAAIGPAARAGDAAG